MQAQNECKNVQRPVNKRVTQRPKTVGRVVKESAVTESVQSSAVEGSRRMNRQKKFAMIRKRTYNKRAAISSRVIYMNGKT